LWCYYFKVLISHLLAELARYGTRDERSTNRNAAAIITSPAHHQHQTAPSPNASRIPACVELSEREGANKVGEKGQLAAGRQKERMRSRYLLGLHSLVPRPSSAATPPLCEGSTQKHATQRPRGAASTIKSNQATEEAAQQRFLGDGVGALGDR
jgi:hypothetical protein